MKKLNSKYFKGRQSIEYTELAEHKGEKLQIHIERDSLDSQSSATISIWSKADSKWNLVNRIPYSLMSVVKNDVYYGTGKIENEHLYQTTDVVYFDEDVNELKRMAKLVLD